VPAPRAELVPARARLEPAVRRVQSGAAQRALLLFVPRGRGGGTSRLEGRSRGRRDVRFRSRTRRRRGRLRARGARRRDVAHRGHRRKRHPTTSPRARRAATASALSAAEPRTRRELSSSERARASRVDPTQPRSRAIARLPSGRAGPPLGASPGVSPGVCAPRGASVASRTEPASGKRRAPRLPTARASANLERLCTGTTAAHHTRPKSRRAQLQTGAP
jgi:hypothetical protein